MQTLQYVRSRKATTDERMLYLVQHMRKLLSTRDHWTQGVAARDKFGRETGVNDLDAVDFCLEGAYGRITGSANLGDAASIVLWKLFYNACWMKYHRKAISDVNDLDGYEAVLDVLSTVEQTVMGRIARDKDGENEHS